MAENTLSSLKAQERDARRKLILGAARELFAKKNFRSVTVREIARAAGMSIGTIYYYYDSLDEIFLDVFLKSAESIILWLNKEFEEQSPTLEDLCSKYVEFLYEDMTFCQIMSNYMLGGEMSEEGTEKLNRNMRTFMDRLSSLIENAAGIDDSSRTVTHALFASMNGIVVSYARYPGRNKSEILKHSRDLAELIGRSLQSGVSA